MKTLKKEIDPTVGLRIKFAREDLGYTQEYVATNSEISTRFLCDIEAGNKECTMSIFKRICETLGVSSNYILNIKIDKADEIISDISRLDNQNQDIVAVLTKALLDKQRH